tara:strand:+ start:632 stop:1159 length:528 start_codon:yes stop_codon:yes gene_type:complete
MSEAQSMGEMLENDGHLQNMMEEAQRRDEDSKRGGPQTPAQILWALKRPFDEKQLKQRPGPGNKTLTYIDARAVQNRLDAVLGIDGWQTRFTDAAGSAVCELSIRIGERWITKSDGAGETSIEGEKGQFSDAFKRAAVHFGVGRYLYHAWKDKHGNDARPPSPATWEAIHPRPGG